MIQLLKKIIVRLLFINLLIFSISTYAAQQFAGLCSRVRIQIQQELALERIGFLATLEITNNEVDASITDFSALLTFEQLINDVRTDVSSLFFVQPPEVSGVSSIDGTGILPPGQTAVVTWFIIPKTGAGGVDPAGVLYDVGASLSGSVYAQEIPQEVFEVIPDTITVKPDPALDIIYFQPRDVDGDNPFTLNIVESPIPFTLGVIVKNDGYGTARKVTIDSQQPRIVEDEQGLLIVPQLIGSRVDDAPRNSASLKVTLGDIQPGNCRKAAWDMITTLSGEFTEFKASYTHATELGGIDTSVIKNINAYFIVHEVLNDQPGRDDLLDFLAVTDPEQIDLLPDTLFETDCNQVPVNRLLDVSVSTLSGLVATVTANADFENWVFMRLDDPAQAKFDIESVIRSDGKILNVNNYWTNIRYQNPSNEKLTYLNILDFVTLGEHSYTVKYKTLNSDAQAPITNINFSGEYTQLGNTYYVLPETQIFFIVEDENPVSTLYRLDGLDEFKPAFPFNINTADAHQLEFYSVDRAENIEATQTVNIIVSDTPPAISDLTADTQQIFLAGDALSVRPTELNVNFSGSTTASAVSAAVQVYSGVYAWPSLTGIPSTPTQNSTANLIVSGENVDFYQYRLGTGNWTAEIAVTESIQLTALAGTVNLSVRARSRYGDYLPDGEELRLSWRVNATAPATTVSHPKTPSQSIDATLSVTNVDLYRYQLDDQFYRAEAAITETINLTRLTETTHSVNVIGKQAGVWQDQDQATKVSWLVDRQYGLRLPESALVYQSDVPVANPLSFVWQGVNQQGALVAPGWYSVKVTLIDDLNRSSSVIQLVQVGDLLVDGTTLSSAGNAKQLEPHAYGEWLVWQDQRNGNWDIYAQNLHDGSAPIAINNDSLNQQRPRTDGKFVVWEDRQADGSWDIWMKQLGTSDVATAITVSADRDEKKPIIYWPWVVYQAKSINTPTAAWQLYAYNLITQQESAVDLTGQDQIDVAIYKDKIVWQDFRDVGVGEIYYKDLRSNEIRRITNNTGGQFYPVIYDQWIVWADNRNTQFDLYGFNLLRNAELQLTNTNENETRPYINDKWVLFENDASGVLKTNIKMLHLSNLATVQLTNVDSEKQKPSQSGDKLVWIDNRNGVEQIMLGSIPDLQPVFNNRNTVAISAGMSSYLSNAFTLLAHWNQQVGITEVTRFSSLLPVPISQTATWNGSQAEGDNFALKAGEFIWIKFDASKILDLSTNACTARDLLAGVNVFSYFCFPDHYSAYQLANEIGLANINALRLLDSESGQWKMLSVANNAIVGEDFNIPSIAVIMMDMKIDIVSWKP